MDLFWDHFNSSLQTKTHIYLKTVFLAVLACVGGLLQSSAQPHERPARPLQRATGHVKKTRPSLLIPVTAMGKCKQANEFQLWHYGHLVINYSWAELDQFAIQAILPEIAQTNKTNHLHFLCFLFDIAITNAHILCWLYTEFQTNSINNFCKSLALTHLPLLSCIIPTLLAYFLACHPLHPFTFLMFLSLVFALFWY